MEVADNPSNSTQLRCPFSWTREITREQIAQEDTNKIGSNSTVRLVVYLIHDIRCVLCSWIVGDEGSSIKSVNIKDPRNDTCGDHGAQTQTTDKDQVRNDGFSTSSSSFLDVYHKK